MDEIAKELNISKRNLQRALRIGHNLTDSMKELLDTGEKTNTNKCSDFMVDKQEQMFYNHSYKQKRPIRIMKDMLAAYLIA